MIGADCVNRFRIKSLITLQCFHENFGVRDFDQKFADAPGSESMEMFAKPGELRQAGDDPWRYLADAFGRVVVVVPAALPAWQLEFVRDDGLQLAQDIQRRIPARVIDLPERVLMEARLPRQMDGLPTLHFREGPDAQYTSFNLIHNCRLAHRDVLL